MTVTLSLILLMGVETPTSLEEIRAYICRAWSDDKPVRSMRVRCSITLRDHQPKSQQSDPALSSKYFPVSGESVATAKPQQRWQEDVGRRGIRYFARLNFDLESGRPSENGRIECLYDGQRSWQNLENEKVITRFEGVSPVTALRQDYYGDLIGFPRAPNTRTRTLGGDIREPFELDRVVVSADYAVSGEEQVDGERCIKLERSGLDSLWLAQDKGWAIVKREWCWKAGGPPKRRIVNRNFRRVTDEVWLPYRGEMEIFGHPETRPGQRVAVLTVEVIELEVGLTDAAFEPHFPPGKLLVDMATGARFPWDREGEKLDRSLEKLRRFAPPEFRPNPWWRRAWLWWTGALSLALGATAIVLQRMWRGA